MTKRFYAVQKKRFKSNDWDTLSTHETRLEAYDVRDTYRALSGAWWDKYRVVMVHTSDHSAAN